MTPTSINSGAGAAVERRDRRAASHRFGEDQAERFVRRDGVEQGARAAEQGRGAGAIHFAPIHNVFAVDMRRDLRAVVVVLRRGQDQPLSGAPGDRYRFEDALALGEPAKKEHVVVRHGPVWQRVDVDRVMDNASHVQSLQLPRLRVGDGDEGRVRIARPERHFGGGRPVVDGLDDGNRCDVGEREGDWRVLRLGMDSDRTVHPCVPVSTAAATLKQLTQLPRPERIVLVVAVRERRMQPGRGIGRSGGVERDVMAARPPGPWPAGP